MTDMSALWMPLVLSAVVVFFVSSLIHMVSGFHTNDYLAPPNQDGVGDALRQFNIPPGDYMIPKPTT